LEDWQWSPTSARPPAPVRSCQHRVIAAATLIDRVRSLCLALPEAFEVEAWEHPTFRIGSGRGKIFCIAAEDGSQVTVKADSIEREALLEQGAPFFMPAYVGHRGWIGVQLDDSATDWREVAELIATSYCLIAPKGWPSG
jgi:predicted DNA-binding protein (MmcQ/YjbR family)